MTQIPPFEVKDSVLITLALGKSAHNLVELRDRIAEVPAGSLLHHFYEGLLRPSFDDPEYRNDFALWARRQLFDGALAERLGILSPFELEPEERHRGTPRARACARRCSASSKTGCRRSLTCRRWARGASSTSSARR